MPRSSRRATYSIVNWDRYQSSTRGSRHWVKLHVKMLDDPTIRALDDHQFRVWVGIIMLAGRTGNVFLGCGSYLAGVLATHKNVDLRPFLARGLIKRGCTREEKKRKKERKREITPSTEIDSKSAGNGSGAAGPAEGRPADPAVAKSKEQAREAVVLMRLAAERKRRERSA